MKRIAEYAITSLLAFALMRGGCELFWYLPRGARAWSNFGMLASACCAVGCFVASKLFRD